MPRSRALTPIADFSPVVLKLAVTHAAKPLADLRP